MKVLYVNTTITHYNHPLLNKIVDRGCELVMCLPDTNTSTVGLGVKRSENSERHYNVITATCKRAWYGKDYLPSLPDVLKQIQPQVLLIGWPYMLQLYFFPNLMRQIKKQHIKLILHEIPFQVPPYGSLQYFKQHPIYNEEMQLQSQGIRFYINALLLMAIRKRLYAHADASLNYCSAAYDIWPTYGVPKDKIFVRYNSGDTDAFFERKKEVLSAAPILPPCSKRVLHIGRLVAWKRVDLLIEAYSRIFNKHPDSELTIIGDGPEKEQLMVQAKQSVASSNIRFVGGVYDPFLLGQYMHESSVYVLAGMGGLSINDAMCYQLPVICSVCDGTEKDLVQDNVNGCFFKEGDAADLQRKIDYILSNEQIRTTMGQQSLRIIEDKINIHTVADNYIEAFEYVLR